MNLLLLNQFYPVISHRYHNELKKKATIYCGRFGHSLWSAISCQRNVVKYTYKQCRFLTLENFILSKS